MEAGALCFVELLPFCQLSVSFSYFRLSATATATATVAPTIGFLPILTTEGHSALLRFGQESSLY